MSLSNSVSDEPSRVRRLTQEILPPQSGLWRLSLDGQRGEVALRVGADAMDDCAVYSISGAMDLVVGSDYVRGPGFSLYELGVMENYDIAYYLVGANLSDIAAMGARPIAFLSVIRYPKHMPDSEFEQLATGVRDACALAGVHDVGGDIGTAERIVLSGTAIGVAPAGRALKRSGAKPGDLLVLGGKTGIAGAALRYFRGKITGDVAALSHEDEAALAQSWKRVDPQLSLGVHLSEIGSATSCQDTSDGLRAAIEQIAAASGVGFEVFEDMVPIDPIVQRVADATRTNPSSIVFGDSVDFRLLFTIPNDRFVTERLLQQFPEASIIGAATELVENVYVTTDGHTVPLPGAAWKHQT